jgi:hypothetical protein
MPNECWCGMDHSKVEQDYEGNWYEIEDYDEP